MITKSETVFKGYKTDKVVGLELIFFPITLELHQFFLSNSEFKRIQNKESKTPGFCCMKNCLQNLVNLCCSYFFMAILNEICNSAIQCNTTSPPPKDVGFPFFNLQTFKGK